MHARKKVFLPLVAAVLAGLTAVACERPAEAPEEEVPGDTVAEEPVEESLYTRLGGEEGIRVVVDDFVARAAADDTLNFTRAGTPAEWEATPENVALLKDRLVSFIGQATGGPQTYQGRDMAAAHAGMQITDAEFDRLGGHLVAALEANGVPEDARSDLVEIVETTRSAIVTAEGEGS